MESSSASMKKWVKEPSPDPDGVMDVDFFLYRLSMIFG